MRKSLLCLASLALAVPAAAHADGPWLHSVPGDLSVYYSYAYQKVEQSTETPSGSGIGVNGEIGLPLDLFPFLLFVDGMYQYNGEDHAEFQTTSATGGTTTFVGLGLSEQVRAGGGLQFALPTAPVLFYAKADYVHYRFDSPVFEDRFGNLFRGPHDNDDGAGYFGGFRARLPVVEIYGQGGYLNLADTDGQEFEGGFAIPLGPIMRRRASVQLFAEYQWTRLHERDTRFHDIFHDYRAGIRIPFY